MADKQASYAAWRKAADAGQHPAVAATTDVVFKQFVLDVQPDEGRRCKFTITTSSPDRERDVVDAGGVDTTAFEKNPIVLFAHDYRSLPVGRCIQLERTSDSIVAVTEFATADLNPMAEQVYRMVKAGFLKGASIGFRPLEWNYDEERRGVNFHKVELLEYSIVPVPANAMALIAASADGIDAAILKDWAERTLRDLEDAEVLDKGVSPKDVSTSKADEGTAWSAPSLNDFTSESWDALSSAEKRRIAGHYAWAESMPPKSFGGLKLPHHQAKGGAVVWRGVVAAIARLNQAQIPSGDVGAVKAHLRRHYKAFRPDSEAPDALKSLAPFDRDYVGWSAYTKAVERAQKRAGDQPLSDETLADMLADYGFDDDAAVLRGKNPGHNNDEPDDDTKGDMPEMMKPDENGKCPAGYMMGDDKMCHMKSADHVTLRAQDIAAIVDAKIEELRSEMKSGRVLSKANEGKLRQAQDALVDANAKIADVLKAVEEERADDNAATVEASAEPEMVLALDEGDDDDAMVLELDEPETKQADAELVEIDAADLMGAIRGALSDIVRHETQTALNSLRGRID